MPNSAVLSVRLNAATKQKLDKLASLTRRSKSFLAAEAIEEFVAIQEWQISGIEQALASADAGEGVGHDEVGEWIVTLGTDDEAISAKG
jgi:predicted transcriptional regulator